MLQIMFGHFSVAGYLDFRSKAKDEVKIKINVKAQMYRSVASSVHNSIIILALIGKLIKLLYFCISWKYFPQFTFSSKMQP